MTCAGEEAWNPTQSGRHLKWRYQQSSVNSMKKLSDHFVTEMFSSRGETCLILPWVSTCRLVNHLWDREVNKGGAKVRDSYPWDKVLNERGLKTQRSDPGIGINMGRKRKRQRLPRGLRILTGKSYSWDKD